MAFGDYATLVDNFNRADGTLGGSWTDGSLGTLNVASNRCSRNAAGWGDAYRNTGDFGPDCEAWIEIQGSAAGGELNLGLRTQQAGAGHDGYALYWKQSTSELTLLEYLNLSGTSLASRTDITLAIGDKLGLELIGSAIKAYRKVGAGAWTEILSATDATYAAAGPLWVALNGTQPKIEEVWAGTIPSVASPRSLLLTGVGL